ncbi:clathrin coat assembly protein AP180A [Trichomonascus vanleenenianus]|uniref:clathrin coat assembly protein AP180A n=1 Tax=Trichomonascus vanleenenianus TaxID=2268995 RepID=UPI003ECB7D4A
MTYEKVVKGATKIKLAAPKPKYIEPILQTTFNEYDNDVRSVMNALSARLKDSAWTIVYKALLVLHYMIRDGAKDVALEYLSQNAHMLEIRAPANPQAISMARYAQYLHVRAVQFRKTQVDYVRYKSKAGEGRLKELTVEKGLLRECRSVYKQIDALLKCKFLEEDVNNDIVLTAFRLLVNDLLSLYQVFNEGVINLLEHYFEMSKIDATYALDIYEGFTKQTSNVVAFLKIAKHLEAATKLRVPNIRHAPTSLTQSLKDYLNDPDFEINHRQYLAEKEAQKNLSNRPATNPRQTSESVGASRANVESKPAGDLIDLFSAGNMAMQEAVFDPQQATSSNQYNPFLQPQQPQQPQQAQQMQQPMVVNAFTGQPMMQQQLTGQMMQPQFTGPPQQPYGGQSMFTNQPQFTGQQQTQPQFTGQQQTQPQFTGQQQTQFTGQQQTQPQFTGQQQAQPQFTGQQQAQPQLMQQPTNFNEPTQLRRANTGVGNPFRQSMLVTPTGNPFKRASTLPVLAEDQQAQLQQPQPQLQQLQPPQQQPQLQRSMSLQRTGTNPFARQQPQALNPQSTGANPFRKSMFMPNTNPNASTYQPTFGGLESLPTVSVFPQTQQQQQNQYQHQNLI